LIKEPFNPSVCSGCGHALLYKLNKLHDNKTFMTKWGYEPDLRRCPNDKCLQVTDVSVRCIEDEKHKTYHDIGADPRGGRFNNSTERWECKE